MPTPQRPENNDAQRRQTMIAVIVIGVLALGGWWVASALSGHNDVQNCIASGRRDCVPIVPDSAK